MRTLFPWGVLLCALSTVALATERPAPANAPVASANDAPTAGSGQSENDKLAKWNATWVRVQQEPRAVTLGDHWRVCDIKFRFRSYRDLFQCLDLMEQRAGTLATDNPQRQYAPLLSNWMRSFAYAELGQDEAALAAANRAWELLPPGYRDPSWQAVKECFHASPLSFCKPTSFQKAALEAGGTRLDDVNIASGEVAGRSNPAGLDLRPQAVAISLGAQRGVLYAQRGDAAEARRMLQYLDKWDNLKGRLSDAGGNLRVITARELPGLQFALGDYKSVIQTYHHVRAIERANKFTGFVAGLNSALYLGVPTLLDRAFGTKDLRRFASALDVTSDEFLYATSLARLHNTADSKAAFAHLLANPELRDMGSFYWAALYEYSQVLAADGQRAEATRLLQQAADAIERVRTTITFEAGKIGFAANKQAVYAALVAALADSGDWEGAFETGERAKARALVDLLAQSRDLPPPPTADDKVRALFASAQTSEANVGLPAGEEAVRGIQLVAESRASLMLAAPEAASLLSVQRVPLETIRSRIAQDETLIEYYSAGDDLYAFVVSNARVTGLKLSAKGLEEEVRAFRDCIARRDSSTRSRAQALYTRLLQPLMNDVHGDKLTISPHGSLHYLPFGALQKGEEYLIDRFSLRITPSASALVYLRTDHPTKPGKLLALGNPDLGEARYDLPNAQIEAQNVAGMFPDSRALVRAQASKSAVKELGGSFSMLHFATHGRFDADAPLSSGVYLSKGAESDGVLTVSDLYSLRWDADLVTLSACETALGKVANGDDVIGLTRGFLYAGARSIVASLWQVDDAATEKLMVSFYRNLDGHSKRDALRLAQIETRRDYPQPVFWAAFQITGDAQ